MAEGRDNMYHGETTEGADHARAVMAGARAAEAAASQFLEECRGGAGGDDILAGAVRADYLLDATEALGEASRAIAASTTVDAFAFGDAPVYRSIGLSAPSCSRTGDDHATLFGGGGLSLEDARAVRPHSAPIHGPGKAVPAPLAPVALGVSRKGGAAVDLSLSALKPLLLATEARGAGHVCAGDCCCAGARPEAVLREMALARSAPACPGPDFPFARHTMWHVAVVPAAAKVAAVAAPGQDAALAGLLATLCDALTGAGAQVTFTADKCKFKAVSLVGGCALVFRCRVYAGTPESGRAAGGYSVELQKRSGDSLAWHELFARVVDALPEACRPAAFAQGAPRPRLVAPPAPVFDDDDSESESDDGSQPAAQPLLRLIASGHDSVRREAATALARLACEEGSACRFAEDGTLAALVALVRDGVQSDSDAVLTATAAAALANAARRAVGVTVAAANVAVAAIPAMLTLVEAARFDGAAATDGDLERMAMRRECGRALAELAGSKRCASEIERASGLGKLTQATQSADSALVGYAQMTMARVVDAVC